MMSDDELRSELNELAEQTEIEPAPLDQVQARGRRRTLYQRGGAVLAAFALVIGGTVAVTSLVGDEDETDVATEETGTTSTDDDGAADDAEGGDDDAEAREETSATEADDMAEEASVEMADIAFEDGYYGGPQRIVPWGEGFLSFGERFIEAEPAELGFDGSSPIADYFTQEILDVVAASGATTLDEATAALEEAGLLEEATAIVTENPEVMEWYSANIGGGTYEPFVEYSADGETWEPVDGFAWPSEQTWYPQVAGNGTHLAVVEHQPNWDSDAGRSIPTAMTVHVTTDLSTWTSVEVPYTVPSVADYVQLDVSPQQLVLTDDSWLLTVTNWQWIDLWSALPADVLDELNAENYDWMPTEDGIEIVDWGWDEYEETFVTTTTVQVDDASNSATDSAEADEPTVDPAPASEPEVEVWEEPEPTVIRVIPWSEMPFTYDEYMNADGDGEVQAFLGELASGSVAEVESPGGGNEVGQIIVTDAGLFTTVWEYPEPIFEEDAVGDEDAYRPTVTAWFSSDGRTWQERSLPAMGDDDWLDSVVALDNGVLATMSSGPGAQRFFVGAADGAGFTEVDGPDLPEFASVWFPVQSGMSDGAASVIDLGSSTEPFFPAYEVRFSHDGFEITVVQDGEGTGGVTVVDGDGATVHEYTGHVYEEPWFEYGDNGAAITDDDDVVIVTIPHEVMEQEVWQVESRAWEAYHEANPYVPDFWLVATRDGRTWTTLQLPPLDDEYGWYGDAVVIGDRVLITNGTGASQVIPLP